MAINNPAAYEHWHGWLPVSGCDFCIEELTDEQLAEALDRNGLGCGASRRSPVTPCELGDAMRGTYRPSNGVRGPQR